jgi:predicted metal-binding membrane protein
VELTSWKARRIACCANALSRDGFLRKKAVGACKHGVGLALHGGGCCANLMAALLVIGVMDLRVMAAITGAMITERMAPARGYAVRAIGLAVVAVGLGIVAQAVGL